jgi:hypothetical protein
MAVASAIMPVIIKSKTVTKTLAHLRLNVVCVLRRRAVSDFFHGKLLLLICVLVKLQEPI